MTCNTQFFTYNTSVGLIYKCWCVVYSAYNNTLVRDPSRRRWAGRCGDGSGRGVACLGNHISANSVRAPAGNGVRATERRTPVLSRAERRASSRSAAPPTHYGPPSPSAALGHGYGPDRAPSTAAGRPAKHCVLQSTCKHASIGSGSEAVLSPRSILQAAATAAAKKKWEQCEANGACLRGRRGQPDRRVLRQCVRPVEPRTCLLLGSTLLRPAQLPSFQFYTNQLPIRQLNKNPKGELHHSILADWVSICSKCPTKIWGWGRSFKHPNAQCMGRLFFQIKLHVNQFDWSLGS